MTELHRLIKSAEIGELDDNDQAGALEVADLIERARDELKNGEAHLALDLLESALKTPDRDQRAKYQKWRSGKIEKHFQESVAASVLLAAYNNAFHTPSFRMVSK